MKKSKLILFLIASSVILSQCENKKLKFSSSDSLSEDTGIASSGMMKDTSLHLSGRSAFMKSMQGMMNQIHHMKMSGNTDYDLAMMLIHHHKGAINMSQAELKSGTDQELKEIALEIIEMQQREILDLKSIAEKYKSVEKNYSPKNKKEGLGRTMNETMMSMMEMGEMDSTSIDNQFASMMIIHHQNGVKIGEMVLHYSRDDIFKSLTQKMIEEQGKGIQKLQQWLDKQNVRDVN